MPSPDLSQYVDLTLYDKDAQDIFDAFIVDLASKLPDWRYHEVNTEVLLGESLALEIAEEVFAINRLPGAITEILVRLYGIERDVGAQPTALIRFVVADTAGHSIPAGTRVRLNLSDDLDPLVFTTTEEATIAVGTSEGVAAAAGDRFTAEANGTIGGTPVELLDAISFVDIVKLEPQAAQTASVIGGREAEDDITWLTRGVNRFARLSETLSVPAQFALAALERLDLGVFRAFAVDNYNPNTPGTPPGSAYGYITVAVYGQGDVALTQPQKDALDLDLEARAQGNLAIFIVSPDVTAINVTTQVRYEAGFTKANVEAACSQALRDYLNTDVWDWSNTVRRNQLIALLSDVPGVAFVETLTVPAGDVALAGVAPLARAGTLSITGVPL